MELKYANKQQKQSVDKKTDWTDPDYDWHGIVCDLRRYDVTV